MWRVNPNARLQTDTIPAVEVGRRAKGAGKIEGAKDVMIMGERWLQLIYANTHYWHTVYDELMLFVSEEFLPC